MPGRDTDSSPSSCPNRSSFDTAQMNCAQPATDSKCGAAKAWPRPAAHATRPSSPVVSPTGAIGRPMFRPADSRSREPLTVAGTAADAGDAAAAARHAARTCVGPSGAATNAGDAATAARTAAGTAGHTAGTAVAVGVAAASAWLVSRKMSGHSGGRCRAGRENFSRRRGCYGNRCSDSPSHHQWFHGVKFR